MTRKIALSVLCLLLAVLSLFSGWKIYSELSARQREKDEFSDLAMLFSSLSQNLLCKILKFSSKTC